MAADKDGAVRVKNSKIDIIGNVYLISLSMIGILFLNRCNRRNDKFFRPPSTAVFLCSADVSCLFY
jgi:hypothetical protein